MTRAVQRATALLPCYESIEVLDAKYEV